MPRISGASWMGGCYLYVDYTVTSQSVSGNYSDISYTFGIHFGDYVFNSSNHSISWSANPGTGTDSWSYAPSLPWPHGATDSDYVYRVDSYRIFHNSSGAAKAFVSAQVNPSSFGGGGTRTVSGSFNLPAIPRMPSAPPVPVISSITDTSVVMTHTDGASSLPVTQREIAWNTVNNVATATTNSAATGVDTIEDLLPATTYYFWARTRNSAGWGAWSSSATATTLNVPAAPSAPVISAVTQTSVTVSWTPNSDGGSPITNYEVGWSLTNVAPTYTVTSTTSPKVLTTNLEPGKQYFFWVRAQNAIGWGPYSASATSYMVAGARVKVGGVWVSAVPYIKHDGEWKLAQPYVKQLGIWKATT